MRSVVTFRALSVEAYRPHSVLCWLAHDYSNFRLFVQTENFWRIVIAQIVAEKNWTVWWELSYWWNLFRFSVALALFDIGRKWYTLRSINKYLLETAWRHYGEVSPRPGRSMSRSEWHTVIGWTVVWRVYHCGIDQSQSSPQNTISTLTLTGSARARFSWWGAWGLGPGPPCPPSPLKSGRDEWPWVSQD